MSADRPALGEELNLGLPTTPRPAATVILLRGGDDSLEVLLVQGPATRLRSLCDALRKVRGVQQLRLFTTTALLPPLHEQERGALQTGTKAA